MCGRDLHAGQDGARLIPDCAADLCRRLREHDLKRQKTKKDDTYQANADVFHFSSTDQNTYFNANCTILGAPAVRILPKVGLLKSATGFPF